jgi:fucose 4-O-acetylase-like acetyltransferase
MKNYIYHKGRDRKKIIQYFVKTKNDMIIPMVPFVLLIVFEVNKD